MDNNDNDNKKIDNQYSNNEEKNDIEKEYDDEEYNDDEFDDEEFTENNSKIVADDLKTRLFKILILITVAVIVIILLLTIVFSIFNRNYSYGDVENIMASAAESYFKKYPDELPKSEHGSIEIDAAQLSAAGEMKPLYKYLGKDTICSGKVVVERAGYEYVYIPKLNCGDIYITQELNQKVRHDNKTTTTGYGLYNKGGNYVFRGEVVNNYVKLDKALWRILKITSKGDLVLITDNIIDNSLPWDDRYNQTVSYASGINLYQASRIKESIEKIYKLPQESEEAEIFLSNKDKTKLVPFNLCVGKRGLRDLGTTNAYECRNVMKNQYVGLITVSDYMAASTDKNCKTVETPACQNYNYLVNSEEWWTVTASKENTYEAYVVDTDGEIEVKTVNNYANLRPVVYLNSKTMYNSGKGTKSDPYTIK